MVKHLLRATEHRLAARAQHRDGPDESGSLILDILIGMAIFALIAIIAVSAVGQYRGRAYVQAAVSDATATANALNATITDMAGEEGGLPTGVLREPVLDFMGVTPTRSGDDVSVIAVMPGSAFGMTDDDFMVCVEHRSAYAVYATDLGGIIDSGNIDDDNFDGCALDGDDGGGGDNGPCTNAVAYRGVEFNLYQNAAVPYPAEVQALGLGEDELFVPALVPDLTAQEWADYIEAYDTFYADGGDEGLPQNFLNKWSIYGSSDWIRQGDGTYIDGSGTPVTYLDCGTYD